MPKYQEEDTPVSNMVSDHDEETFIVPMPENQEQDTSIVGNMLADQDEITSSISKMLISEEETSTAAPTSRQESPITSMLEQPRASPSNHEEAIENAIQQDASLTTTITVVEALLLSGLKVSVKNIIEALQLVEALVETVSSNQTPPFLKIIKHNVDTNAYAKLSKRKKASHSGGRDGSPEKIAPHAACARCQHNPAVNEPALTLRSCLNCESVEYCSIECQLTDWMAHRNLFCVNPTDIPLATLAKPHRVPFLKTYITNPFARLAKGIWLHDRHKQDVYVLLIDSFRLREADDFTYGGMTNNDSVYSGRCLTKGIDKRPDNYHDLHAMTRDIEIVVVYEDAIMTMQLRMFAELVLGKGAAGSDGRLMLQKMVVAEEAARVSS
ncbi:hypothetical protein TrVFT333_007580 [Trichoderma virens FT-333]|nr:hypothetical protein TrVFT333_007580 [Trichoderma virens FT-333]